MSLPRLAKAFFSQLDEDFGPFDRPFQFQVFPFDAGGALNLLTIGAGRGAQFVTYVTWDLLGQPEQKRGSLGRYELTVVCDDRDWCGEVLTNVGRQSLREVFEPGDTLDLANWVTPAAPIQGVVFEAALCTDLRVGLRRERCGLLRCIGITRPELQFARTHGASVLLDRLRHASLYPRTSVKRESIQLSD